MKKLLGLLSVLIISGTSVPTAVAASPYQKEKNKLENDNNMIKDINNLKRKKRQGNEQNIFGILKIVIETSDSVSSSGIALNNKVYFGFFDNKVYEYDPATGQQKLDMKTNAYFSSDWH